MVLKFERLRTHFYWFSRAGAIVLVKGVLHLVERQSLASSQHVGTSNLDWIEIAQILSVYIKSSSSNGIKTVLYSCEEQNKSIETIVLIDHLL